MHLFILSNPAYVSLVRKMSANGYHLHHYDNGFLFCFKDRNLFLYAKMQLKFKGIFFTCPEGW